MPASPAPLESIAPGRPPKGRAMLAFALSLGVHVGFFGLLAWSMHGEPRPIVIPVELVFGVPAATMPPPGNPPENAAAPTPVDAAPDTAEPAERAERAAPAPRSNAPGLTLVRAPPSARRPERIASSRPVELASLTRPARPSLRAAMQPEASDAALELAVLDWLRRHQIYPRAARRAGLEGTARVRFVIDRTGVLREHELVASSGHAVLDRAALELLERAAPYPALPRRIDVDTIELTLPVEYRLGAAPSRG